MAIIDVARPLVGVGPDRPDALDAITEGRWRQSRYAWCGDYPTYCAMVAGCMDATALNRVAVAGYWQPGYNIARLVNWAQRSEHWYAGRDWLSNREPCQPGDFLVTPREGGDHIAIIDGVGGRYVRLLNGNGWMGRVSASERPLSEPVVGRIATGALVAPAWRIPPVAIPMRRTQASEPWWQYAQALGAFSTSWWVAVASTQRLTPVAQAIVRPDSKPLHPTGITGSLGGVDKNPWRMYPKPRPAGCGPQNSLQVALAAMASDPMSVSAGARLAISWLNTFTTITRGLPKLDVDVPWTPVRGEREVRSNGVRM